MECPHCGQNLDDSLPNDHDAMMAKELLTRIEGLLSEDDFQLMTLLAQGKMRKEVAGEMKTSRWVINHRIERILSLLGVRNTTAAAVQLAVAGALGTLMEEGPSENCCGERGED